MEIFYKNLKFAIPSNVYYPAEDSFMLADAAYPAGKVLEVGCGCGIASICWAKDNQVLGVDINPDAVKISKENAKGNSGRAEFMESDLFSNVSGKFDAILFNPPYLPTNEEDRVKGDLNRAFDGGPDGRAVLGRFLQEFERYLAPSGRLFLVQSSLNGAEETISFLKNKGFMVEVVDRQEFFFEKLFLIRASKP